MILIILTEMEKIGMREMKMAGLTQEQIDALYSAPDTTTAAQLSIELGLGEYVTIIGRQLPFLIGTFSPDIIFSPTLIFFGDIM